MEAILTVGLVSVILDALGAQNIGLFGALGVGATLRWPVFGSPISGASMTPPAPSAPTCQHHVTLLGLRRRTNRRRHHRRRHRVRAPRTRRGRSGSGAAQVTFSPRPMSRKIVSARARYHTASPRAPSRPNPPQPGTRLIQASGSHHRRPRSAPVSMTGSRTSRSPKPRVPRRRGSPQNAVSFHRAPVATPRSAMNRDRPHMRLRMRSYTTYSIACPSSGRPPGDRGGARHENDPARDAAVFAMAIGWTSATIARSVYHREISAPLNVRSRRALPR